MQVRHLPDDIDTLKRIILASDARVSHLEHELAASKQDGQLLTLLIETWEQQHHPIGPPHPIEMIRHRMRTAGYTQADLATLLGSRARASEVLRKKRRLTLEMMRQLSREWKIPAETLLEPYRLVGERSQRVTLPSAKRKAA